MLKKTALTFVSLLLLTALSYVGWCVRQNYKTGEWSESCGFIFTNPHYHECVNRRRWLPRASSDTDLSARLVPKENPTDSEGHLELPLPTMWVVVDPFQQFGGSFVQPAPSLPQSITGHPCQPGSLLWQKKYQWVCVKDETRPKGWVDDVVVPLLPAGYSLDK